MAAEGAAIPDSGPAIVLCADDYGMSEGIGAGIEELAAAGRLSATSALVTTRWWRAEGGRIRDLREKLALGLHFNLTLGSPLSRMRRLAPDGVLPPLATLLRRCLAGRIGEAEIRTELLCQIDCFEAAAGQPPDMIDGHQHAHALPGIGRIFLETLAERFPQHRPLVRDPGDRLGAILARRVATRKAIALAVLARGFGARARAMSFETNSGFSGFSAFDERIPFAEEFARNLRRRGRRHMMMCHPGYPDAELAALDPVVARRRSELEALRGMPGLGDIVFRPQRSPDTGRIAWPTGGT